MESSDIVKILSLISDEPKSDSAGFGHRFIDQLVIVRTYSAGVWFGSLSEKSGNEVILTDARRLWRWHCKKGISLSSLSVHGLNESKSKIAEPVDSVWLEAIEIIPCKNNAAVSISGAVHAKAE